MGFSRAFEISASGMEVERQRLEVAALNLANAGTTGSAFHRKVLVARARETETGWQTVAMDPESAGVSVEGIVDDPRGGRRVHDPGHPDADAAGWVEYPNVDPVGEMVDVMAATRAYEANAAAFAAAREMALRTLEAGRS